MSSFSISAQVEIFNASNTWTCPAGVTSVKVECWGGGGGGGVGLSPGGGVNLQRSGGGGGGGSYVTNTIAVVPGTVYNITVGAGGISGPTGTTVSNRDAFGNPGGKSEFSGGSVTAITASGGTGGCGGTPSPILNGGGGVLGGVYGYTQNAVPAGSGYFGTPAIDGDGNGATAEAGLTTGMAIQYLAPRTQGFGYTVATVYFTEGSGATLTALVNPDINAGGTATLGVDGGDGSGNSGVSVAGAGGAAGGVGGGAGGAVPMVNTVGNAGIAPGGGGSGASTRNTSASAVSTRLGGMGASGRVVLTFSGTIPVELISFSAKRNQNSNLLTWATASEKDNAYFDIERSNDGKAFKTIGRINAKGTSLLESRYTYEDETPSVFTHYYRLRQVDFDGTTTFSKVVAVSSDDKNGQLSVYPTLATDKINVVYNYKESTYSIFNLLGQNVQTGQILDNNELIISELSKGTYVLRVGNKSIKFVKN